MLTEARTRRLEFLGHSSFWVRTLAILLAITACGALLLLKPVTRADYSASNLTEMVPDKLDYGIYPVERDGSGQTFRWLNEDAKLIFPANSKPPVKITLRLRGATAANGPSLPTTVLIDGIEIGKITPGNDFQDYSFTLAPPYNDKHRLNLELVSKPGWKPKGDNRLLTNMIQGVSLDISEAWSPVLRPGRAGIIWLLPVLALLTAALALGARFYRVLGYGSVLASGAAGLLMLIWLAFLARVSYNGELNKTVFWGWVASSAYLAAFFGWLALEGLSWGSGPDSSLWRRLKLRFSPLVLAHPLLAALTGLVAVNFAFTAFFYAKIFFEAGSLDPVVRYLDGPEYIFIANGFYDRADPLLVIPDFRQHSPFYWTAHFPGYPLVLRLFWLVVGWQAAGPLVNFLASSLFAFVFWLLLKEFRYTPHPFWLASAALVLPLRWLIYHSVGASEPLMLLFELLSLYFFKKDRYWLAGLSGAAALFVRPPGIFLWLGYMLFFAWEALYRMWQEGKFDLTYVKWRALPGLALIPLSLGLIFGIYAWRYGDFLAYFHISEEVKHLGLFPLPSLAAGADSGAGFFYFYLIEAAGLVLLWRQGRRDLFWVGLTAFGYTLFLVHNDILRYSLPAFPLIVAIPFAPYLTGKAARWLAGPVLLGVYLYSWGVFNLNLAGLDTWQMMRDVLH